jgi:hypothetical protein
MASRRVYFRARENPWRAIVDPVGSRRAWMARANEGDEAGTRRRRRDEAGGVGVESGGARTTGR